MSGQLLHAGARSATPVPDHWVTLHRVGPDSAAPVDSTRTTRSGQYHFTYRRWGSDQAVYFVSSTYDGIAYFSQPLEGDSASGGEAAIMVFDTTSGPLVLHVRGHHVILSRAGTDGARTVVEVFELTNDSTLTLIPQVGGPTGTQRPTWETVLPADAHDFQGGAEGVPGGADIPPDAIAVNGNRVQVFAPFGPGPKQLSFSYTLAARDFPLRLPVAAATQVLEVLLEDSSASAVAPGIKEINPVSAGGHSFRRLRALNLPAGSALTVSVAPPGGGGPHRNLGLTIGFICALVALAVLSITALLLLRRSPSSLP